MDIKVNQGLSEFYGAMLGDGCLSQYFSNYDKKDKFCVLLTGHTHDEPYYRILQKIFFKEFGIKGYIRFRPKYNAVRFETISKRIFDFFKKLDFPIGLKIKLKIPNLIYSNNKFALACLRGIFDTDGSIYRRYSKKYKKHTKCYKHLVIQFKMNSQKVIEQIKEILERNNIKTTKIGGDKKSFVLRITKQNEIHKFMKMVNSKNKYHVERYLNNLDFSKITGP